MKCNRTIPMAATVLACAGLLMAALARPSVTPLGGAEAATYMAVQCGRYNPHTCVLSGMCQTAKTGIKDFSADGESECMKIGSEWHCSAVGEYYPGCDYIWYPANCDGT